MMSARKAGNAATVTEGTQEAGSTDAELPRVLIFATAIICGLFLALTVHIGLTGAGAGLTSIWRDLFPTSTVQLKSALAWWAIGGAACLGSWGTVLVLRKTSARLPLDRMLKLALSGVFFCLLVAAGHAAAAAPNIGPVATAAANLAAMCLGAFMAFCTAHFAIDR
jgi:hypothetical protein